MLFNSINFALFLPIVFLLYWFVFHKKLNAQNTLLLISSYFFYACWDWRFLFLLAFSTLLDYYTGIKVFESKKIKTKRFWFWLSIFINVGLLCVLKYFNFFASTFAAAAEHLGFTINPWTLQILVPIGISFYTFHGLSYLIDIYNNRIIPEKSFLNYSVFVCFFPLLVAGPIERATHLLPQIQKSRTFDYGKAVDGLRQILWGLFKKIVIADQCAEYTNLVFTNPEIYSGSTLLLGAILFAIQIYADFSGYTDIALGTARLFGIELLRNFAFPYFSRSLTEFWRRWHISLSTWFRDYVYIPLGGNKHGKLLQMRNTAIIFLIGGFWHGANWTFIIWGLLNAFYMIPSIFFNTPPERPEIVAAGKKLPSLKDLIAMIRTFSLIGFTCIFFRSEDLSHASNYFSGLAKSTLFTLPALRPVQLLCLIVFFISIEWIGREQQHALGKLELRYNKPVRWIFYNCIVLGVFLFKGAQQAFIYFQF